MSDPATHRPLFDALSKQPLVGCVPFVLDGFIYSSNLPSQSRRGCISSVKSQTTIDCTKNFTFEQRSSLSEERLKLSHPEFAGLEASFAELGLSHAALSLASHCAAAQSATIDSSGSSPTIHETEAESPCSKASVQRLPGLLHTPETLVKEGKGTISSSLQTPVTAKGEVNVATSLLETPATEVNSTPDIKDSEGTHDTLAESLSGAQKQKILASIDSVTVVQHSLNKAPSRDTFVKLGNQLASQVESILEREDATVDFTESFSLDGRPALPQPEMFLLDLQDVNALCSLLQRCLKNSKSWLHAAICESNIEKWACQPLLCSIKEAEVGSFHRLFKLLTAAISSGTELYLYQQSSPAENFDAKLLTLKVSLKSFEAVLNFQGAMDSALIFKGRRVCAPDFAAEELDYTNMATENFAGEALLVQGIKACRTALESNCYAPLILLAQGMDSIIAKADSIFSLIETVSQCLEQTYRLLSGTEVIGCVDEQTLVLLVYVCTGVFTFRLPKKLLTSFCGSLGLGSVMVPLLQRSCDILCWIYAYRPKLRGVILDDILAHGHKIGEPDSMYALSGMVIKALLLDGKSSVPMLPILMLRLAQSVFPQTDYKMPICSQKLDLKKSLEESFGTLSYFLNSVFTGCINSGDDGSRGTRRMSSLKVTDKETSYRASLEALIKSFATLRKAPEYPVAEKALELIVNLSLQAIDSGKADLSVKGFIVDCFSDLGAMVAGEPSPCKRLTDLPKSLGKDDWTDVSSRKLVKLVYQPSADWLYSLVIASDHEAQYSDSLAAFIALFLSKTEEILPGELPGLSTTDKAFNFVQLLEMRPEILQTLEEFNDNLAGIRCYFPLILHSLLQQLESFNVTLRTKSLRSLQAIVRENSSILGEKRVQEAVSSRCHDSSPSVREAAIELVNRFVHIRSVLRAYYPLLSTAVNDPGTAVRKRTLKILSTVCLSQALSFKEDFELIVDIVKKIMHRMRDSEPSVSELSFKLLVDFLLPTAIRCVSNACPWTDLSPNQRLLLLPRIAVVKRLSVLSSYHPLLNLLFKKAISELGIFIKFLAQESISCLTYKSDYCVNAALEGHKRDGEQDVLEHSFASLVLISKILPNCFCQEIGVFGPFLMRSQHSEHSANSASNYLLTLDILHNCFSELPDADWLPRDLAIRWQSELIRQLPQCTTTSAPYVSLALSGIVCHYSKDWRIISKILCQCVKQLEQLLLVKQAPSAAVQELLAGRILALASIFKSVNLDSRQLREELQARFPETASMLCKVFPGSGKFAVSEKVLVLFSSLAKSESNLIAKTSVQACGILWMSNPMLLNHPDSLKLIYLVLEPTLKLGDYYSANTLKEFDPPAKVVVDNEDLSKVIALVNSFVQLLQLEASDDVGDKAVRSPVDGYKTEQEAISTEDEANVEDGNEDKLLSNTSRSAKRNAKDGKIKSIDMKLLKGNAESLAAGNVASCIIAGFLPKLAICMLVEQTNENLPLVQACFTCVRLALELGLTHPITVLPAIATLESSVLNPSLATRAQRCHQKLAHRHGSFVHQRNMEAVSMTFLYCRMCGVSFFENEIPLLKLFQVVSAKKSKRNAFLSSIVRIWDIDGVAQSLPPIYLEFAEFVAINVAGFPYKSHEELYIVIKNLNQSLATFGSFLARTIAQNDSKNLEPFARLMQVCLLLKQYLRDGYKINEAKVRTKLSKSNDYRPIIARPEDPFVLPKFDEEVCYNFVRDFEEDTLPQELDCSSPIPYDYSFDPESRGNGDYSCSLLETGGVDDFGDTLDSNNSPFEPVLAEVETRSFKRKASLAGSEGLAALKRVKS